MAMMRRLGHSRAKERPGRPKLAISEPDQSKHEMIPSIELRISWVKYGEIIKIYSAL